MLNEGAILVQNTEEIGWKIISLILEGNNFYKER